MIHGNAPRHGSTSIRMLLAALLLLAAVGLSQCRMVSGPTGLDLTNADHGRGRSCTAKCNRQYRQALYKELWRHHKALRRCHRDRKCRSEEKDLHRRNLYQLLIDRRSCKSGCYNEGGGRG